MFQYPNTNDQNILDLMTLIITNINLFILDLPFLLHFVNLWISKCNNISILKSCKDLLYSYNNLISPSHIYITF